MLNLYYTCDHENVNGSILLKLEYSNIPNIYNCPLSFSIKNSISQKEVWSGTLTNYGDWSSFPFGFHSYIEVKDCLENKILEWEWNPLLHGDIIHKFFNLWALNNKGAFGAAIGTHDGTSGEWVNPIRNGLLKGFLVEASINQYMELVKNYKEIPDVVPLMALVTPNGGETSFFELGSGHINSVKLEHVSNYASEDTVEIIEKKMNSISIVDLFLTLGEGRQIKWLHLDVEGIDSELLFALGDSRIILPEVIIYESLNLQEEQQKELLIWLGEKEFETIVCGWNTLAVKKKPHE